MEETGGEDKKAPIEGDLIEGEMENNLSMSGWGRWKKVIILFVVLLVVIAGGGYLYKRLKESGTDYYTKHQKMGQSYLRQGQWDLAIKEFKKNARVHPEKMEPHYGLGMAYFKLGKFEEAVESFEKALTILPDRTDVRYSLGVAYQRLGRLERALEEYHKVAEREPASPVFNNLGIIQMQLGNYENAFKAFNRAIEIEPDYYPSYFNLARAYRIAGKPDLAARQYKYIKERASRRPETKEFVRAAEEGLAALGKTKNK